MALSKSSMAGKIADKMVAAGVIPESKKAAVILIWTEICDGIIEELKTNGVISTTVTGSANLTSGEVTGTGSGSIT